MSELAPEFVPELCLDDSVNVKACSDIHFGIQPINQRSHGAAKDLETLGVALQIGSDGSIRTVPASYLHRSFSVALRMEFLGSCDPKR